MKKIQIKQLVMSFAVLTFLASTVICKSKAANLDNPADVAFQTNVYKRLNKLILERTHKVKTEKKTLSTGLEMISDAYDEFCLTKDPDKANYVRKGITAFTKYFNEWFLLDRNLRDIFFALQKRKKTHHRLAIFFGEYEKYLKAFPYGAYIKYLDLIAGDGNGGIDIKKLTFIKALTGIHNISVMPERYSFQNQIKDNKKEYYEKKKEEFFAKFGSTPDRIMPPIAQNLKEAGNFLTGTGAAAVMIDVFVILKTIDPFLDILASPEVFINSPKNWWKTYIADLKLRFEVDKKIVKKIVYLGYGGEKGLWLHPIIVQGLYHQKSK